jgi:hypothetical protein
VETCNQAEVLSCGHHIPDKAGKTSDGAHNIKSLLEHNHTALTKAAACLAVDDSAIVIAATDGYGVDEAGTASSDGRHSAEPHDDHEAIEGQDDKNIIDALESSEFLREERIGDDEPREDTLIYTRSVQNVKLGGSGLVELTTATARPSSSI